MRTLFYFVTVGVILLIGSLSGCSDEFPLQQDKPTNVATTPGSALERALERADEFFAQIGEATRTPRRVGTVGTLVGATTRSESDTLLFLVNYADNMGFALLGADPAINDIYAISPTGSLTGEDINNNPVLADFLYDVVSYATIGADSIRLPEDWEWPYWRYKNIDAVIPMLSSTAANWNQKNPYNLFSKNSEGKVVDVGCVPLSVGMLLSYYEKPKGLNYEWTDDSIPKFNFDWETMLYSDSVLHRYTVTAHMFPFLGNKILLNTDYNDASGTQLNRIVSTISQLGGGPSIFDNVNFTDSIDSIAAFLIKGRSVFNKSQKLYYTPAPLLVFGIYRPNKRENHMWIIDGVVTRKRTQTDKYGRPINQLLPNGSPSYTDALPMWHCIWGQKDTSYDGWYVYLKDKQKLDTTQYDPFSKKVALNGLWPTGVEMYHLFEEWRVFAGFFPTIKKK